MMEHLTSFIHRRFYTAGGTKRGIAIMELSRTNVFISTLAAGFLLPALIPRVGLDYPYFSILVIVLFAWFLIRWERVKAITSKSRKAEVALGVAIIGADYAFNALRASNVGLLDLLGVLVGAVILVYGLRTVKLFWVPVAYGIVLLLGYQVENSIPNYVALQDWLASLMTTWANALGITASVSGHLITMNSGSQLLLLSVEGDCTGIQGVLSFGMLSTMALIDAKPKMARLIPILLIGFGGVFLLNFVRLFAVIMTFEFLGVDAGTTAHLIVGYLLFIVWILVFWQMAFKYLYPRSSSQNIAGALGSGPIGPPLTPTN
jgi:exosortase/archaeosortase family protein